jgi:hypothetical protein
MRASPDFPFVHARSRRSRSLSLVDKNRAGQPLASTRRGFLRQKFPT